MISRLKVVGNSGSHGAQIDSVIVNRDILSCFGSKRSQVRILSPRPFQPTEIIKLTTIPELQPTRSGSLPFYPYLSTDIRVGRKKFGFLSVVSTRVNCRAFCGRSPPVIPHHTNHITKRNWHKGERGDMAKRFTDTEKWKKEWFRELGSKYRDIWNYLCDNCNHAGIWEIDLGTMHHFTGHKVVVADLEKIFGDRILLLPDRKLFVRGFFDFQYGSARKDFKARLSALNELRKYGLVDEAGNLLYSLPKCSEDFGETPKCPSNSNSTGNSKSKEGGPGETKALADEFESLYKAFPRKRGKDLGMTRLLSRFTDSSLRSLFARAVTHYADECAACGRDDEFTMHWSTFVGTEGNEPWRDYIDPPTLKPKDQAGKPTNAFESLANKLLSAVKQFPPGDDGIAAFMGLEWEWISRSRLMSQVRSMKADDFAVKRLAQQLAEAKSTFQASHSEVS